MGKKPVFSWINQNTEQCRSIHTDFVRNFLNFNKQDFFKMQHLINRTPIIYCWQRSLLDVLIHGKLDFLIIPIITKDRYYIIKPDYKCNCNNPAFLIWSIVFSVFSQLYPIYFYQAACWQNWSMKSWNNNSGSWSVDLSRFSTFTKPRYAFFKSSCWNLWTVLKANLTR